MKKLIAFTLMLLITSCNNPITKNVNFNATLDQPCMIVNYEQDNTIEGRYLKIQKVINDSIIKIKIPQNFYVTNSNYENWVIGWGTGKPYYDAGVENIRTIKNIDLKNGLIILGDLSRGNGFPSLNQNIVFWNKNPSNFKHFGNTPVINTSLWNSFNGNSIHFSTIEYDNDLKKWVMIFNECDTPNIQIYAAISINLKEWFPANEGKPLFKSDDFTNCSWAGKDKTGKINQVPFTSDIIRLKNKWYLFLDGYSNEGKRNIGYAVSESTLLGPYKISKNPILTPGTYGSWNDDSVFYAKVKKYKDGYLMFYDGRNSDGMERIGKAFSKNLLHWENSKNNPVIDQHTGWRSYNGATEPNNIEIRHDSILLMIGGIKKFKMGRLHRFINLRNSGNIDDAQLGLFLSTDEGNSFIPHKNNPIFTNDYSNKFENEHMGGNYKLIKTDTADYLFYQAKSSYQGSKYNIMSRIRRN